MSEGSSRLGEGGEGLLYYYAFAIVRLFSRVEIPIAEKGGGGDEGVMLHTLQEHRIEPLTPLNHHVQFPPSLHLSAPPLPPSQRARSLLSPSFVAQICPPSSSVVSRGFFHHGEE